MHNPGHEGVINVAYWAEQAAASSPLRLFLLGLLLWSLVSILLVAGLGAWVATMRSWRHRR